MQIDPFSPTPSKADRERYLRCIGHPRGFLANYPAEVIAVINGIPITKTDILQNKQARQRRQLAFKRRDYKPLVKPCIIKVFWSKGIFCSGWWLCVKTLHRIWYVDFAATRQHGRSERLALKIVRLFPCGYLPMKENFEQWKLAFANIYQGSVTAWAEFTDQGKLLDVRIRKDNSKCR